MAASMVPVASVTAAQNKNPPKTDANKTEEPSKKTGEDYQPLSFEMMSTEFKLN